MAFDLIVFGATGFTARFVLMEIYEKQKWNPDFRWAISGRQTHALNTIKSEISRTAAPTLIPHVITADVHDYPSMLAMAKQAALVLNCVGPYRNLGEPVVKACIETGADYLDLCGEPEFIERMSLEYHDKAVAAGVSIIHAAAFDSVPCDFGVLEVKRAVSRRGATPSSVEVFFQLRSENKPGIHYATYQAAVEGFGSSDKELRQIRKQLSRVSPRPQPIGRPLAQKPARFGIMRDDRVDGWLIRYFFSARSDPAVVRLTQTLDALLDTGSPPVHFAAYLVIPSLYAMLLMAFYFSIFQFMAGRAWGRKLLLEHPKLFTAGLVSKAGPTEKQYFLHRDILRQSYSQETHATQREYPDVNVTYQMSGPEPGYVATPAIFVRCAAAVLRCRSKVRKGVLTPAVAFRNVEGMMADLTGGGLNWTEK